MKIKNILSNELQPDMTLYEDLFNNAGKVVLYKDTILDELLIEKIKLNKIEKAKIKFPEKTDTSDTEVKILSIYDEKKMEDFKKKYASTVDEVTALIKAIGNGAYVDLQQVNEISKNVIQQFNILSDVLNYMQLAKPLDDYTFAHSLNVSLISIIIAKWLGMSDSQVDEIATAGLLHDIGKTKISEAILSKPGKLTPQEFDEIKKHTLYGFKMVEKMEGITENIKYSVLLHHEKIDGSGYPLSIKESEIPLFARIIAIADIYDAMTSNRSYRERICPFDVIKDFEMQTFGKLDTKSLTVFLKNIANSYTGDFVELNSGDIGEIVFINPNRVWQPIIKCGSDFIDLSKSKLTIKSIV